MLLEICVVREFRYRVGREGNVDYCGSQVYLVLCDLACVPR